MHLGGLSRPLICMTARSGLSGHRRGLAGFLYNDQDVVIRVAEVRDPEIAHGWSLATEEVFGSGEQRRTFLP